MEQSYIHLYLISNFISFFFKKQSKQTNKKTTKP